MAKDQGWIKLHRKLKGKGYYKESEYVHLWVHLLLEANHEGNEFLFNGKVEHIKPGQLITSRQKLSQNTGIDENKVERILKCFKTEQQIEQVNKYKFRLITVNNWNDYQNNEQQNERAVNSKRTASEQQVNTNKNVKNEENEKNEKKGEGSELALATPKPADQVRTFFSSEEKREEIIQHLAAKGIPVDIGRREISKFTSYWTEPNKSGTRVRWETEPTFEIGRRLQTWLRNLQERGSKPNSEPKGIRI